jgi:hypothetical protein
MLKNLESAPPPLGRGAFLLVTTSETKYGFLLIETFRKFFNTQNYGHQDSILGGLIIWEVKAI